MKDIKENAVSKEQVNYLVQSVEKVLDNTAEIMRQREEEKRQKEEIQKENVILKEKLDHAVEILQRLDEKTRVSTEKKKGLLGRLFGG
ncbi:hypothetical protein [Bacillus gobiensis]|uniref:hypothetical protein n=1 Tax=Bacillus gobiensis TaxID=1441095 RepID=UPI003D233ABC